MFIGNGGGVLLAYDDGGFTVPGKIGRPKRVRFPAVVPEAEPVKVLEPEPEAATENVLEAAVQDL